MSDFVNAIQSLERFNQFFGPLLEAIPDLQKIDSLENHITELTNSLEDKRKAVEEILAQESAAKEALEATEKAVDERKADLATWVAEQTKTSQEASQTILDEAQVKADAMIAEAADKVSLLDASLDAKQVSLKALQESITQAQSQYDAIQAKLEAIKNSI